MSPPPAHLSMLLEGIDCACRRAPGVRSWRVEENLCQPHALVHSASIQDRDGGATAMATLSGRYPFLLKPNADGGYPGPVFQTAIKDIMTGVDGEIVKRSDQAKGLVLLPKRRGG